jgi:hypothetical protein
VCGSYRDAEGKTKTFPRLLTWVVQTIKPSE